MIKKRIFIICLLPFLLIGIVCTAQGQTNNDKRELEEQHISKKQMRKLRPSYLDIGIGLNSSKFRDFATSPLFYKGSITQISLSKLRKDNFRETQFGVAYDFGKYNTNFNDNITISSVKRIELFYSRLFQLNKLSSTSYNTKIGFQLNGTGNIRINEALQNNSVGKEFFCNLLGSIKWTKDISRKATKQKKIFFIKYKLSEKKRELAFRLNVGLINSSYRNGYVYSGQSQVLNDSKTFDGYEYKLFSGRRLSSSLDYTRYLKNKNAIQFSYISDFYKTGGEIDKFEMAHHTLRFSLFFNTNNH